MYHIWHIFGDSWTEGRLIFFLLHLQFHVIAMVEDSDPQLKMYVIEEYRVDVNFRLLCFLSEVKLPSVTPKLPLTNCSGFLYSLASPASYIDKQQISVSFWQNFGIQFKSQYYLNFDVILMRLFNFPYKWVFLTSWLLQKFKVFQSCTTHHYHRKSHKGWTCCKRKFLACITRLEQYLSLKVGPCVHKSSAPLPKPSTTSSKEKGKAP
jgi:hypothetical protein